MRGERKMAKVKISKFKLLTTAWGIYKKLKVWWKESSVDGEIDVNEFSNLWKVFAEVYEDLSGKKISVKIPTVKELKPVKGKMRKNISIKEVEVDEKPLTAASPKKEVSFVEATDYDSEEYSDDA